MFNKYDLVVGLEVHVELLTKSKVFCSCKNEFGKEPNEICCPVCLGMPGALPVLNEEVVNKAIAVGKLLNCKINKTSKFDRKHFMYADLVKNFQITQFDEPICENGVFPIVLNKDINNIKNIEIERIHIEEDAGKVIYKDGTMYIDYNRSGKPLVEIVTKPVFETTEEVRSFLEQLKISLTSNGISHCKMNEGSYRFDVNISIKKKGETTLGNRCEIKNMNSFNYAIKAINKEVERQVEILEKGETVQQQSLTWDEKANKIVVMREKESVDKYKYLRELNLPILKIDDDKINNVVVHKLTDKVTHYVNNYKLNIEESLELIKYKQINDIYEQICGEIKDYKLVSNFFIEIMFKEMTEEQKINGEVVISVPHIIELLQYLKEDKINNTIMKKVYEKSKQNNKSPKQIIHSENLFVINDVKEIENIIKQVLDENEKLVEQYKSGKTTVFKSIVGKVMSKTNGLVNAKKVNDILNKILDC